MTHTDDAGRTPTPKRILIVEQYDDTRRMLTKRLQYSHHRVTATDEAGALSMEWSEPFDAVIVGVGRTATPAVALLKRLRKRQTDLPAVALASCPWGSALDALICGGFTALLPRPCPPDEILASIQRLSPSGTRVAPLPSATTQSSAGVFSVSVT